ncbi:MAG: phage late control D family protein [Nitrospirae bacterium]|nr:phage late control D family protein [Nitrospirota bacterium]
MPLTDIAEKTAQFYAPRFEVEIEGKKLKGAMEKIITDISITEKVDEGASFSFTLYDEFDLRKQRFKWLEHELFQIGNKTKISLGYENNLETMIEGKITSIEPSFFSGELPTITITGHDLSFDYLKRPSPAETFKNTTYGEIAEKIARGAGLQPVVDRSDIRVLEIKKQNNESYYRFLKRLAGEIEFVFFVYKKTMYFVSEYIYPEEITLSFGRDLISFKPSLNTSGILKSVEVRGHNPKDPSKPVVGKVVAKGLVEGEYIKIGSLSKKIENPAEKVIDNVTVTSVSHARKIAESVLKKANQSILTGEGSSIGVPQIRAGITLQLERLGSIFSGRYYVTETTHSINNSGYLTRFSVIRREK